MSLRTPSKTGAVRDCCVEGRRRVITVQKPRAVGLLPVCLTVKPVGEPDALIGHVRFDERGWETERCRMAQATAPILDSTFCDLGDQLPLVGFRIDSGRPEGFAKVRKDFPDGARSFPVGLFNFPVPLSREFARNSLNQRSYSAAKSSDRRLNRRNSLYFPGYQGIRDWRRVRIRLPPPPRSPDEPGLPPDRQENA